MPTTNRLIYVRQAVEPRDGVDGLLFLHSWGDGGQELIFRDETHASEWAARECAEGRPTIIEHLRK